MPTNRTSCVYVGLAGETAPGRPVKSGLYETVYVGTQRGPFRSADHGEHCVKPQTTVFTIAFDERQPRRMYCATNGGEVFASEDGGGSWVERPLPEGATQVYAMGCA